MLWQKGDMNTILAMSSIRGYGKLRKESSLLVSRLDMLEEQISRMESDQRKDVAFNEANSEQGRSQVMPCLHIISYHCFQRVNVVLMYLLILVELQGMLGHPAFDCRFFVR